MKAQHSGHVAADSAASQAAVKLIPYWISPAEVQLRALTEFREEQMKLKVEEMKARMLRKRWWHRLLPFTIEVHWR